MKTSLAVLLLIPRVVNLPLEPVLSFSLQTKKDIISSLSCLCFSQSLVFFSCCCLSRFLLPFQTFLSLWLPWTFILISSRSPLTYFTCIHLHASSPFLSLLHLNFSLRVVLCNRFLRCLWFFSFLFFSLPDLSSSSISGVLSPLEQANQEKRSQKENGRRRRTGHINIHICKMSFLTPETLKWSILVHEWSKLSLWTRAARDDGFYSLESGLNAYTSRGRWI